MYDDYEDYQDDPACRKNSQCELRDGHSGKCRRYRQHDSLCGCDGCARAFDAGMDGPRFSVEEL
jgi:hypothetical protein